MGRTCIVGDCTRAHYARGFCKAHYQRDRLGIGLEQPLRRRRSAGEPLEQCQAPRCLLDAVVGQWCSLHASRAYRGIPLDAPPRSGKKLAFRHAAELLARGHSVDEIAECFGVEPVVVSACLALAPRGGPA